MNCFYEHHRGSIRWHYRCFDRILLNGLIQPFQQPERVVGFFNTYRQLYPVSRHTLRDIAEQFQRWLKGWSEKRNIPVAEGPERPPRRLRQALFQRGTPRCHRGHCQSARTGAHHDGDRRQQGEPMAPSDRQPLGGPVQLLYQRPAMGTDVCPHLSLPAVLRPRLPQSASLAGQAHGEEGIDFKQCDAFTRCAKPERLQQLANSLTPWDLLSPALC